ncbi:hypothetical protein KKF84_06085, partial [Myxococcota bacterium]|nr:hypothetical protein [Myxococcota bacterium]
TGDAGEKRQMWQTLRYVCEVSSGGCLVNVPIPGQGDQQLEMPAGTIGIIMDTDGGICHGDSGGPALVTRSGQQYVGGVHSFVIHNDLDVCDYFGASTKVDNFENFIEDFIHAEVCNNGIDDDGDGDTDCDDSSCASAENCIPNACDDPFILSCGDSISDSTGSASATSAWSYYNAQCTNGFTVNESEIAFALDVPVNTEVTVNLSIQNTDSDLELFLLKGSCEANSCVAASTNPPGTTETLSFTTDSDEHFIMVETWQNEGAFTISVECNDAPPLPEICDNGIDDDQDGFTDCADSDCQNNPLCDTSENCTNGTDDDGDGFSDCADADCYQAQACLMRMEDCSNSIDDDDDGAVDCEDADCLDSPDCDTVVHEICDNGIDDNGDGVADCNDPLCRTSALCPHPIELCDNGKDDDGDRLVDCDDADCHSHATCTPPQGELCINGIDDDNNGLTDCEDEACASHHYCVLTKTGFDSTAKDGCTCHAGSDPHSPRSTLLLLGFLGLIAFSRRRRYLAN